MLGSPTIYNRQEEWETEALHTVFNILFLFTNMETSPLKISPANNGRRLSALQEGAIL